MRMNNATLSAICWISVSVHLTVGVLSFRRIGNPALLPVLNLVVALCTLAYWVPRWYNYLWKGVTWYASDQLVPL